MSKIVERESMKKSPAYDILAQLPSEWVIMDCFSYGLEHTGQDFQAKIRLIA